MKEIWKKIENESKITRQELITFIVTTVAGILMYYQMPDNWLTNPDTVWNSIYFRMGHGGEKNNGRILQIVVDKLRMNMVTPVLTTIFCIVILAIIALLIIRLFEIENVFAMILVGQIIVFVPCTSSALTYFYCSDSFVLAYLFAVIGAYIIWKYPSNYSYLISGGFFVCSMYLYQAYICVVFMIAVMKLITEIFNVQDEIISTYKLFIRYVVVCGISLAVYVVTLKILQILLHIEMRTDRGFGFTNIFGKEGFISLIKDSYVNFYQYFWGNKLLNNEFGDRNIINMLVVITGIALVVMLIVKKKIWKSAKLVVLTIIGICVLPLAAEAITIMSPAVDKYGTTGIIMVPTMAFVYILVIVLIDLYIKNDGKHWIKWVTYFVISAFVWNSIVFTNLCINTMKLNLNKTETVANLIVDNVLEQYGYEKNQKLLIAGSMEDGNFPSLYDWPMEVIKGTSASYGFMWNTYTGNEECWINFLKQYKGIQFESCNQQEYEVLLDKQDYIDMPLFPNAGSVKMIDDVVVVKMSNVELE